MGITLAILAFLGKVPDFWELLTRWAKTGASMSTSCNMTFCLNPAASTLVLGVNDLQTSITSCAVTSLNSKEFLF